MSLIKCIDCGKDISDIATSCPYCGRPTGVSVFSSGMLHLYWANVKGNTYLKTSVFVDGEEVGRMKSGEYLDLDVSPGSHTVELHFRRKCAVKDSFSLQLQSREAFLAFKQTLTGLKLVSPDSVKWNHRGNKASINIPKCPTCGSIDIKKLSLTRKSFSVEMVGLASSSIGKTFVCKNCGYKW